MESCNTESSLDLPLESLSLQPFLQSLHKEQWQEVRLGEVAEITSSKRIFYSEYVEYGIPFYRSKEIIEFSKGNNPQNELFIDENKYNDIANKFGVPQANDILLTSVGTLGIPYLVPKDKKFYFKDGNLTWFKNFKNITSLFLFYWFKSPQGKEKLDSIAIGSTQQALTIQGMKNLIFLLPPLTIQQKIAEILSSFDDKIDLLHRQNKTLESLALTLFRHYFIDNPKRDEWELGKLGDYVKIIDNRGKTPPFTTDITPYPLIEVNALSDDSMLINYDIVRKYVIKETYQKWFREHIKQYDILFSTVGSIGEVAMLLDNKGCIAQNVIGFRARDISPFYLYEWLKYMQQEIKEFDIGSVQPSIKVTHFIEKQIYKPDSKILESFDKQMLLMTNKISHNAKQIQNLQAMRDMLLKAIFA